MATRPSSTSTACSFFGPFFACSIALLVLSSRSFAGVASAARALAFVCFFSALLSAFFVSGAGLLFVSLGVFFGAAFVGWRVAAGAATLDALGASPEARLEAHSVEQLDLLAVVGHR